MPSPKASEDSETSKSGDSQVKSQDGGSNSNAEDDDDEDPQGRVNSGPSTKGASSSKTFSDSASPSGSPSYALKARSASQVLEEEDEDDDDDEEDEDAEWGSGQGDEWEGVSDDDGFDEEENDHDGPAKEGELEENESDAGSVGTVEISEHSSASDGSIEEVDHSGPDRQLAFIVPERLGRTANIVQKVSVTCCLPCLLVMLMLYGAIKCVKALWQCAVDFLIMMRSVVILVVLVLASPLYVVWKLCIPEFVRRTLIDEYNRRLGRKVHLACIVLYEIQFLILDLPNVASACALACCEVCIQPLRGSFYKLWWQHIGRRWEALVVTPMYKSRVNRVTARRRKELKVQLRAEKKQPSVKPKEAHKRERERKARMNKALARKKAEDLEVKLRIGCSKDIHKPVINKERNQSISRTMVPERRYAVVVGVFWVSVGSCMLTVYLEGIGDERCELCRENEQTGYVVCRKGEGQDCAFELHARELCIAVSIIGVGLQLLLYSLFVYRPANLARKAKQKELERQRVEEENQYESAQKVVDPEIMVIRNLQEDMAKPTWARSIFNLFEASPCRACQRDLGDVINDWLLELLRQEDYRRWRHRSVKLQDDLYQSCIGRHRRRFRRLLRYLGLKRKRKKAGGSNSEIEPAALVIKRASSRAAIAQGMTVFASAVSQCAGRLGFLERCCRRLTGRPRKERRKRTAAEESTRNEGRGTAGQLATLDEVLARFQLEQEKEDVIPEEPDEEGEEPGGASVFASETSKKDSRHDGQGEGGGFDGDKQSPDVDPPPPVVGKTASPDTPKGVDVGDKVEVVIEAVEEVEEAEEAEEAEEGDGSVGERDSADGSAEPEPPDDSSSDSSSS